MATNCPAGQTPTDLGCIPNDPAGFASRIFGIGLGLVAIISLLTIVYGGYILLVSQGNREQVAKGRSYITYAIAGLLFAIFSAVFLQVISVNVLQLPGFGK